MSIRTEHSAEKVTLLIEGRYAEVPRGLSLLELSREYQEKRDSYLVGARYNNQVVDLYTAVSEGGRVDFIDLTTEDGMRIYRKSLVLLMTRAAFELFPHYSIQVKHALNKNYYCEFDGLDSPPPLELLALEAKMRELATQKVAVIPVKLKKKEALDRLKEYGHGEKVDFLQNLDLEEIKLYTCGPYFTYVHGVLAPNTEALGVFQLQPYANGFLLRFPAPEAPGVIGPIPKISKLSQVFRESEEWVRILGMHNLAGLKKLLSESRQVSSHLIHIAEALHEKRIAQIADQIYLQRDKLRLILIAGPSSSGKTTFAQRLGIQLRVLGLKPASVSTDDYFVDREHTPRDENGNLDFEALEAVDLPLFNDHLRQLVGCEEVECPIFNFHQGSRELHCKKIQVEEGNPIIIEGIHALNENLTSSVPRENKIKIYISALTMIGVDDHNRIPTTDARLIRRIVRDSQYRSQTALATLKRWPSVRAGEEKNIFPFQEEADLMFNSALVYELGVLKKFAYPLLNLIGPQEFEYSDAQRLLSLLDLFPDIPDDYIPLNSILREFIGGSSFHCS